MLTELSVAEQREVDYGARRVRLHFDGVEHLHRSSGGSEDRPIRDVVVRTPIEDLLDDGVLSEHAVATPVRIMNDASEPD
jgi:hypothetical protein